MPHQASVRRKLRRCAQPVSGQPFSPDSRGVPCDSRFSKSAFEFQVEVVAELQATEVKPPVCASRASQAQGADKRSRAANRRRGRDCTK
eukprot:181793-Rhodomonas_salina.3